MAKQIQDMPLKTGVSGNEDILIQDSGVTKRVKASEFMNNVDLDDYYNKTEVDALLNNVDLDDYYNKTEVDALLNSTETIFSPDMPQSYIQQCLDNGGSFRFTSGTYAIDVETTGTGFTLASGTNIVMDDGVVFEMGASSRDGYQMMYLSDIENVTISGYATFKGDRYTHTTTTGEWGHCFKIEGCKNITLEKITIKEFWGDGIYLGETANFQNENITFRNVLNEDNRRQGISVITCDGLTIDDCVCKNINGINPQAGVDIEPNNTGNIIKNVNINNLRTYQCKGSGLCFSVARIGEGSDVSITVNNHYDYKSTISLLAFNDASVKVQGLITVNDSYYDMEGVNNCISIVATTSLAPKILLNRPRIYMDSTVNNTSSSPSKNAIAIWQPYDSTGTIGNVDIVEPYLFGAGRTEGFIYVRHDYYKDNVEKIHVINPRKDVTAGAASINFQISDYLNDIFVDMANSNNFNLTINYDCGLMNHMQRKYILSSSATANRSVGIAYAPYGYECEFQNDSSTRNLSVYVASDGFKIVVPPLGYAKLKHIGNGNWEVLHKNFDLPTGCDNPTIVVLSQTEYDALGTVDANTLYFIEEE